MSERKICIIIECVRFIVVICKCFKFLWIELVNIVNMFINLSLICVNNDMILEEKFLRIKLCVDNLWIFGLVVYFYILKKNKIKLDSKVFRCFFVGYEDKS